MLKRIQAFIIIDITPPFFTSTYLSVFKHTSGGSHVNKDFLKDSVVFDHLVTAKVYETKSMHYLPICFGFQLFNGRQYENDF